MAEPTYKYTLHWDKRAFKEAQATCEDDGGNLASIANYGEQQEIMKMLPKDMEEPQPFLIGLHEPNKEGFWSWTDGTCSKFRYWDDNYNQPENYGGTDEDCATMYMENTNWKWHDVPCSVKYNFVCKVCEKDCPTAPGLCLETAKAPPAPRETKYEYGMSRTKRRFNHAEKACVRWGGNLVSL